MYDFLKISLNVTYLEKKISFVNFTGIAFIKLKWISIKGISSIKLNAIYNFGLIQY